MKKSGYKNNPGFWRKKEPRVMGDMIGRPQAVDLLGEIEDNKILEAGCGTGYVARVLAQKGAKVFGCDKEEKMLNMAEKEEKENPLGVEYKLADITDTPYEDESFDSVLCVGVLMHSDVEEVKGFFKEARRILRKNGFLVVSVTHPFLFTPLSPSRKNGKNWVKHNSIDDKPYTESQQFEEIYYDIDGEPFTANVYHHTISTYLNSLVSSGLKIEQVNEVLLEKEHLLDGKFGKEYDYPAYFQFRAIKE